MNIQITVVQESEKSVLQQLLELYAHDFTEFDDRDVNEHGFYGYTYLDYYWTEETRHPFFIRVDGKLAGLVLVSGYCYHLKDPGARSVSEFFVMRKYRGKGVGRAAARLVFDKFPGKWEVDQMGDNAPSKAFWERVIAEYTGGNYQRAEIETESWPGQSLTFDNSSG